MKRPRHEMYDGSYSLRPGYDLEYSRHHVAFDQVLDGRDRDSFGKLPDLLP
jgi:hypothetical protein